MKRSLAIFGAAIALTASLTACSSGDGNTSPAEEDKVVSTPSHEATTPDTNVFIQNLPDGRQVLCVWAKRGNGGGLSCDWESLAPASPTGAQ